METPQPQREAGTRFTVVGLFDDSLDAEQALIALQRADRAPELVSLIIRDRDADDERLAQPAGVVARVLVTSALDAVAGWLKGLASLIVPERGTYLVAGPLGAALTAIGDQAGTTIARDTATGGTASEGIADSATVATTELGSAGLLLTLREFGFDGDEGTYLEHRLAAGAALVAVTVDDGAQATTIRRLFGEYNAVHIGMANTQAEVLRQATVALESLHSTSVHGNIVITDAVAPLRHLCGSGIIAGPAVACGLGAVDAENHTAGVVRDILADPLLDAGDGQPIVRYVVLMTTGWLGIGRRTIAVPAPFANLTTDPVRLQISRSVLAGAPAFEAPGAFSRREELAVLAYFGCEPYWFDNTKDSADERL